MSSIVRVIGAGLAGCEASNILARNGFDVELYEAKPIKFSPAHKNSNYAELVCSNSLKSLDKTTASGLLKEEMMIFDSLVLKAAFKSSVPAGSALAVDREKFSDIITKDIKNNPKISVINEEVQDWDFDIPTIIATGPLTLYNLSRNIEEKLCEALFFYDAAAPIVSGESIDYSKCFFGSRYNKGGQDYLNCPLNKEEYTEFCRELIKAERAVKKDFEKNDIFEGCMPIEVMALRGEDTLRFGPLKPVGFTDPLTGKRPYALVQLRKESVSGDMYNIVGFQTNLKYGEQKRVFSLIPALKNAEFLRYGIMHRNTYLNSPKALDMYYRVKAHPCTFFAGQISGVEGYIESAASGLTAGLYMAQFLTNGHIRALPLTTIMGSLAFYIANCKEKFQPMNANFGLLPPLAANERDKKRKRLLLSERSLCDLKQYKENN